MRAVVFANGTIDDYENARALLHPEDTLIAADGGALHCRAMGIVPAVIVGDLDSLPEEEQRYWHEKGVQFIRHDRRKDETDLELALLYAQELDRDETLVLGALGGRWDQSFANILLPSYHLLEAQNVTFWHEGTWIYLIRGQRIIRGQTGQTVSLIPVGGSAHGVSAAGLEWPLENETLLMGASRGISNVLLGESTSIRVNDGLLLCFVFQPTEDKEVNE
jgi:thiamine pyrophosphokinase